MRRRDARGARRARRAVVPPAVLRARRRRRLQAAGATTRATRWWPVSTHDLPTLAGWWRGPRPARCAQSLGLFAETRTCRRSSCSTARQDRAPLLRGPRSARPAARADARWPTPTGADEPMTPALAAASMPILARTPVGGDGGAARGRAGRGRAGQPARHDRRAPQLAAQAAARRSTRLAARRRASADAADVAARAIRAARRPRAQRAPPRADAVDPARHLPPAAPPRLQLRRRDAHPALPRAARHQPRLLLAVPARAAGQHARLRRRRPRRDQSRARRRRGLRRASCAALRAHGMGQLLDIVPNHMGVLGADNAWWLDVLENGQASLYAQLLRHRLASARRRARRARCCCRCSATTTAACSSAASCSWPSRPSSGSFALRYYEHRFPIDPRLRASLLRRASRVDGAGAAPGSSPSIAAGFGRLARALRADDDAALRAPGARQGGLQAPAGARSRPRTPALAQAIAPRSPTQRRSASRERAARAARARRPTGWPTGASPPTRSTTGASSTSTSWPRCAWSAEPCSRPRTASRSTSPPPASSTACASTTPTACATRRSTSSACSRATPAAPASSWPSRPGRGRPGRSTSSSRRSPRRTRSCPRRGRCTARPATASPRSSTACSSTAPPRRASTASGAPSPTTSAASRSTPTPASATSCAARLGSELHGAGERAAAHRARRPAHAATTPSPSLRDALAEVTACLPGLPHLHRRRRRRRRTGATSTGPSPRRGSAVRRPTPRCSTSCAAPCCGDAGEGAPPALARACPRLGGRASSSSPRRSRPRASRTPPSIATCAWSRSTRSAATRRSSASACAPSTRASAERAAHWPHTLLATVDARQQALRGRALPHRRALRDAGRLAPAAAPLVAP